MIKSTLRLFNAVQVQYVSNQVFFNSRTLKTGYIATGFVPTHWEQSAIEEFVGLTSEQLNSTFHKSWNKVRTAPIEQLIIEQIIHYCTSQNSWNGKSFVWTPDEPLDIPGGHIPLTIIRGMTSGQILDEILTLASGIALSTTTLDDIMEIVKFNKYDARIIEFVKNKELRGRLYVYFGIAPSEPVEFLRWTVEKLTGESLLIKNGKTITALSTSDPRKISQVIAQAPADLASIFHRFKPLFLAMKKAANRKDKAFFNRLRKQADTMHRPMRKDVLNDVTADLANGSIDLNEVAKAIESANVWRKVRLANALALRLSSQVGSVYRIRNGKTWVSQEVKPGLDQSDDTLVVYYAILDSLAKNLKNSGKKYFIPEGITYAIPTSEKMFFGNIPLGSSVSVQSDMLVGVYWENLPYNERVDLDLSLTSILGKYGWNASFRSSDRDIMFSGDMVNGRDGATEFFYIQYPYDNAFLVVLNQFTENSTSVPFDLIVAQTKNPLSNSIIDPNDVILKVSMELPERQMTLGLIANGRFYFLSSTGNRNVSRNAGLAETTRQVMIREAENKLTLNYLLYQAGALAKEMGTDVIDLSPASLTKTSIIDILS